MHRENKQKMPNQKIYDEALVWGLVGKLRLVVDIYLPRWGNRRSVQNSAIWGQTDFKSVPLEVGEAKFKTTHCWLTLTDLNRSPIYPFIVQGCIRHPNSILYRMYIALIYRFFLFKQFVIWLESKQWLFPLYMQESFNMENVWKRQDSCTRDD